MLPSFTHFRQIWLVPKTTSQLANYDRTEHPYFQPDFLRRSKLYPVAFKENPPIAWLLARWNCVSMFVGKWTNRLPTWKVMKEGEFAKYAIHTPDTPLKFNGEVTPLKNDGWNMILWRCLLLSVELSNFGGAFRSDVLMSHHNVFSFLCFVFFVQAMLSWILHNNELLSHSVRVHSLFVL